MNIHDDNGARVLVSPSKFLNLILKSGLEPCGGEFLFTTARFLPGFDVIF